MSCGCNSGYDGGLYGGVCDTDTPYPSVSHESVPSLIDNLVNALYGTITKDVSSGKVVWNIPCDPNNTSTINGIPRNNGEGLLCYILRALNLTTPSGFVTVDGIQTLTNKTLTSPIITGTLTIPNGSIYPANLSTGGPSWDASGNLTILNNIATAGLGIKINNTNSGTSSSAYLTAVNGRGASVSLQAVGDTTAVNCTTNNSLALQTNNLNRLFISLGGFVGIGGITNPSANLDVYGWGRFRKRLIGGNSGAQVSFDSVGNDSRYKIFTGSSSESFAIYDIILASYLVYINATGNVGIGTFSPSQKLDVNGAIKATQAVYSNDGTTLSRMESTGGVSYLGTTTNHPVVIQTNNTEKIRIDANGSVKITNGGGYQDPTLIIQGNALDGFAGINLQSSSETNPASIYQDGTNGSLGIKTTQSGSGTYFLNAAGQTNATFFESGRLVIPKGKGIDIGDLTNTANNNCLNILGYGFGRGYGITMRPSSDSATCTAVQFNNAAGTQVGSITSTASVTAYVTSSDYRLKTNVSELSGALDRISLLPVHQFNWAIDSNGQKVDGFLAHEAQAVVPESVFGTKDAVDAEGKPVYQGIDQSKLVPLLTAAIKELKTIVDAQEQRIQALEANINTPTA